MRIIGTIIALTIGLIIISIIGNLLFANAIIGSITFLAITTSFLALLFKLVK